MTKPQQYSVHCHRRKQYFNYVSPKLMKLHLTILLIFISTFSFSQDTLQIDTIKTSEESTVLKNKTTKKKKKKPKQTISFDTIQNIKSNTLTKTSSNNTISPLLFTIIFATVTIIIILIAKLLLTDNSPPKPYDYFKNEYIKSMGWAEDRENNPKRDELLRQLDSLTDRQAYYRFEYLQSEAWQRKRFVVLKRDNWTCVYCGNSATQVHHKRYAKNNIGSEPIDWLVSVCKSCHDQIHEE